MASISTTSPTFNNTTGSFSTQSHSNAPIYNNITSGVSTQARAHSSKSESEGILLRIEC